jgi:hypothetical protein
MIENGKKFAPKKCSHNTVQWKVGLKITNYPCDPKNVMEMLNFPKFCGNFL